MKLRLQNLQRIYKQLIMLFVDVITLFLALWLAFVLRLGEAFPVEYLLIMVAVYCNPNSNASAFCEVRLVSCSFAIYWN